MSEPIICFGQQPNGFFPRRFLYAKIQTARDLQKKIGGKIVFFYHDSDADYRETITIFRDSNTNEEVRLNFNTENKIQKKYSPLYIKKIAPAWKEEIVRKLPRFVSKPLIDVFKSINEDTVADFCLAMYKSLGLLEGIEIVRSSDKEFRKKASELGQYFADVVYEGEIVRAQMHDGMLRLHEGGGKYIEIPNVGIVEKHQKSAARAERFVWMQSVIKCTHYIAGVGENGYLNKEETPEVVFIEREEIEDRDGAYIPGLK